MLLTERWPETSAQRATHAAPVPDGSGDPRACGHEEIAQELLGEMAALIRDTRLSLMVSGAVAAAVLIGLAVESVTCR
jgi:hypothetical protein